MRKTLLLGLVMGLFLSVNAVNVPKKVAYVTNSYNKATDPVKVMHATATTIDNDPIIQVLKADANLSVTVKVITTATEVITDLADYDVIVVQEAIGGGASILMPTGSLALKTIPKPFIYNKNYALQKGRAIPSTSTNTGAGKEATATDKTAGTLYITVETGATTNDLFKACTFENSNQIKLFEALTNDAGELGAATSIKAINYCSGIPTPGTLLAQPAVLQASTTSNVCINDVSANSSVDTETLISRGIFLGMNFGAICANAGKNITDNGLTIWRNAVYILAGLPVPSTKATLPSTAVKPIDATATVKSVEYFTVNGLKVKTPSNGVYVKRTTFENGAVKLDKMVLAEPMMK